MWTVNKVRKQFIDFFVNRDHTFVPSSSSVAPENDKTLLFTNAGMNQFKPIFLNEKHKFNLKRATNSQKCIRAGGKHNDLEDVGKDIYHHTFFEMLGCWSFGDYWKEGAIDMAWDLLVNVYKLNPDKIYATYFGGNLKLNLKSDEETKKIWGKYLPEKRILPFGMKDNFWEMGFTGPCGPCTEIHYDKSSSKRNGAHLVNRDNPTVVEIWNIVFMQYNRLSETKLVPLSNRHVDTGLGLERLTAILQNKKSNYDTDAFIPILEELSKLSNTHPYTGLVGKEDIDGVDMAYRVIVDHIRMACIAISDGLQPGPKNQNLILRNIIRRSIKYGLLYLKILKINEVGNTPVELCKKYTYEPFLHKLVEITCKTLEGGYSIFSDKEMVDKIVNTILDQEKKYLKVLKSGLQKFRTLCCKVKNKNINKITGSDAFKMWTSYGFPLEFMELEANNLGITIDIEEFYKLKKN